MACGCDSTPVDGWEYKEICTLKDAADYVKRRLGAGALCVQVTDQQILDSCCQALRMAYRYLAGEAQKRDYLIIKLIAGENRYHAEIKKAGEVEPGNIFTLVKNAEGKLEEQPIEPERWCQYTQAWDFSIMNFFGGINTLHSAENLLLSDWAMYFTRNGNGLIGYNTAMTWLKQIDNEFGARFHAYLHEPSHTMTIVPTPKFDTYGLLQVWRKTEVSDLLNNPLILDLMEGQAGMMLGRNLSKYQITLAGGGSINGDTLYSHAKELYDTTLERLRAEADPPLFFIG